MPPKAKNSAPPPRFLFVNEDAATVNRVTKDPNLDREKQSHVQRHNFAKRKQQKEKAQPVPLRLHPKGGAPDATTNSTWLDEDEDWTSFDPYSQPPDSTLEHSVPQSSSQSAVSLQTSPIRRRSRKSSPPDLNFPLVRAPSQGRTLLPLFSGSKQILEKWAPPLIQYFNLVVIPEKFPADVRVRPLGEIRHAAAIHDDCSTALTAPVHLYAFLAEASIRMLTKEGRLLLPEVKDADYHRVPLFFKTKALAALRKALTTGLTRAIVTDVLRLVSVSYFSPEFETAEPHFEAMISMIEMLGGMPSFGDYFEETIIIMVWSAGLRTLTPPKLPVNWDPGQGSPVIAEILQSINSQHNELGKRMLSIMEAQQMRPELANIFDDLVLLIRFCQWTMKQGVYDPVYARYALLRHTAIGSRLLFLGKDNTNGNMHEAFRIAMIFWTALTRSPGPGRRCAAKGTGRLRGLLESLNWESWADYYDWLLWIAVVGGLTARLQDEVDLFASIANKATRALKDGASMDLAEMESVLTGFLYEPSLQREPLLDFRARMRKVAGN